MTSRIALLLAAAPALLSAQWLGYATPNVPKGPDGSDGGRGVRGGTFHDNGPWLTRVSLRSHFPEDYKHFDLGFRVVREKR